MEDLNSEQPNVRRPQLAWAYAAIGLLVVALLAVIVFFLSDVQRIYSGRTAATRSTVAASQIQGWMTFRYVAHVFSVPAGDLPGTPNETLDRYAREHGLNQATFVQSIRNAATP